MGQRFGELCVEVLEWLADGPTGAITSAADAAEAVDTLEEVGVPVEATANLLEAYGVVFPNHRLVLQLILDAGYHHIQNKLFEELGKRGLLADWERYRLESEGCHGELPLTNGLRVIVSQMRKQPSLHNPWARPGDDPWVRFYTDEALPPWR
ncbi:MAG TPA: hypothetical protein PK095_22495 [Myxococcota bacterium]|nr:hypothetical protein [Myxococcota bacterium]